MEFKDIASVSGKGGLFRVISPTKGGVILESLNGDKKRLVVGVQTKISVLSDISIYITNEEGAEPLERLLRKIHQSFDGDTGLDKNSPAEELRAFMEHVLPDYDENRVYVSDIKKLVNWYKVLLTVAPDLLNEPENEDELTKREEQESKDE